MIPRFKINSEIEIVDLTLYLRKEHMLVLSDLHLGYEEGMNKQGVFVPRTYYAQLVKRLEPLLKELTLQKKLNTIIINGDLKHEFGTISETEWRSILRLLDLLAKYCENIVLIRGNHDTILAPIAQKRNLTLVKKFQTEGICIFHGDEPEEIPHSVHTVIMGHLHPAIRLVEYPRMESYKCFLHGTIKKKEFLIMPSFFLWNEGSDVLTERSTLPHLPSLETFDVYVTTDTEILHFGRIKDLKRKMKN